MIGKNLWVSLVVGSLLLGCGHRTPQQASGEPNATPTVKGDPLAEQYKKLRTADYDVDSAIQEINDSMEASKTLAPKAGGDAEKALASVGELLDGSGEKLGDYESVADTFEEFKKDFAAQDERRIRAIKTTIDALAKLGDATDILTDLAANVPDQFKKDLEAVLDNVGQAQSDLRQAVTEMGGQLPDDTDPESVDPVQADGKTP